MAELKPCPKVGEYITAVRWDEQTGFRTISAKVTSITTNLKGTKVRAPKAFYPIDISEYDFAPNEDYPWALADFYFGAEPLSAEQVTEMSQKAIEAWNRRADNG